MISDDEIKEILEARGVELPEDEEQYNALLKGIKLSIVQNIGVPITPTEFHEFERIQNCTVFLITNFPVHEIISLSIGEEELKEEEYTLDSFNGLIYFNNAQTGFLKLNLIAGLTSEQYDSLISPLILDMMEYQLDSGWDKNASSISEGDISVSFDTSVGKGALIQSALDDLKNQFSAVGRMI